MGIAGVLLAPIMLFVVKDPPRPAESQIAIQSLIGAFPIVARKPAFWLMSLAASCSSLAGYGLAAWTPSVLERNFGLELVDRGHFLASLFLIGGTTGVFAGGWLADRLGQADRRWYARLPAIAWVITAPTFAAGLLAPNLWLAWPLLLVPNALNILWLGPVTTAVQHLVPRAMRATASASFLLINSFIGLGVGPLLIGCVSDVLKKSYGAESLRYAAVGSTAFYLLAAALMLIAVKHLRSAWVDDATI
jgi:MFS family permease